MSDYGINCFQGAGEGQHHRPHPRPAYLYVSVHINSYVTDKKVVLTNELNFEKKLIFVYYWEDIAKCEMFSLRQLKDGHNNSIFLLTE